MEQIPLWGVVGSPRKEPSSMSSPMNPEEDKSDEAHELSMDSIFILNSEHFISYVGCHRTSHYSKPNEPHVRRGICRPVTRQWN
ncbi:MAG: hypothetical protein QXG99_05080 [Conexivisphaerales archaeon]